MSIIRVTKEFRFEGAHALLDYDGKCRHIHGHSYRLLITVSGVPESRENHPKSGMVLDFSELKSIVTSYITEPFDHALILRSDSPLAEEISNSYENVKIVEFQPTSENLTINFAKILKEHLPSHIKLCSVKLYETSTSFVEWLSEDNPE
jgi:6-pyruvoyl-tetrahydropterin synthase